MTQAEQDSYFNVPISLNTKTFTAIVSDTNEHAYIVRQVKMCLKIAHTVRLSEVLRVFWISYSLKKAVSCYWWCMNLKPTTDNYFCVTWMYKQMHFQQLPVAWNVSADTYTYRWGSREQHLPLSSQHCRWLWYMSCIIFQWQTYNKRNN